MNNKLSSDKARLLDEVSSVVQSANNPQAAFDDLERQLNHSYDYPLEILKSILEGELPPLKNSLWGVIYHLSQYGNKESDASYIAQFNSLDKAQTELQLIAKPNWLNLIYCLVISFTFYIMLQIYKVKVFPVFEGFFSEFGAELPKLTKFVLSDSFLWLFAIIILFSLFVGVLLPLFFRQALCSLNKLPWYLKFIPSYWICAKVYHEYLLYLYSRVYFLAGAEQVIKLAQEALSLNSVNITKNQKILLQTAENQNCLLGQLDKKQNRLLQQLETQIKCAEKITGLITLILFSLMMAFPVIGFYLPIFMLGDLA